MKKIIQINIILYITMILFYGLIIKFTINNTFLNSIRSFLPECALIIIILTSLLIILKEKIKRKNIIVDVLFIYINYVFFINIINKPNINDISYMIRDLYLPLAVLYCLSKISFNTIEINKIVKKLVILFSIFIILGSILGIVQKTLGWQWTSKFYTGYEFYGLDELSKVKIWQAAGELRIPSLTGNSVSFAYYNLIAFVFIWNYKLKKLGKYILLFLASINILISTSKTNLIILFIIIAFFIFLKIKKYLKITFISGIVSITIILINLILIKSPDILFSFKERLVYWSDILKAKSIFSYIIPINLFEYSSSNSGIYSFLDNTYLFFIFGTGILGLILLIAMILLSIKRTNVEYKNHLISFFIIFILASISTNLLQGRCYFGIYMLLMGVLSFNNFIIEEDKKL